MDKTENSAPPPWLLRLTKGLTIVIGILGVAIVTVLVTEDYYFAAGAGLVLNVAFFAASWNIEKIIARYEGSKIFEILPLIFPAMAAVTTVTFLVLGNWKSAALYALLTVTLGASLIPTKSLDSSDLVALLTGTQMDERRADASVKARSVGFVVIQISTMALVIVTMLINSIRELRIVPWPPALGLFAFVVAVDLVTKYIYSRRI